MPAKMLCSSQSSRAFKAGCFRRSRQLRRCRYAIGCNKIARELLDLVLDPSSLSLSRIALGASYRFPTLGHSIYGARTKKLHAVLADILEQAAKDGCLAVNDPTVAAEQFLALVRGELHLHCMYDPSFRPSRVKIERQIDAGVDCFMARYGASAGVVSIKLR